jgi:hypothetical protein
MADESDFERKLTVVGGFPIQHYRGDPDAATPDYDLTQATWMAWGLDAANEHGLGTAFLALFESYNTVRGEHPQVAAEQALRDLDLWDYDDNESFDLFGVFDPETIPPEPPTPVLTYFILREDGSYILREDATKIIREDS